MKIRLVLACILIALLLGACTREMVVTEPPEPTYIPQPTMAPEPTVAPEEPYSGSDTPGTSSYTPLDSIPAIFTLEIPVGFTEDNADATAQVQESLQTLLGNQLNRTAALVEMTGYADNLGEGVAYCKALGYLLIQQFPQTFDQAVMRETDAAPDEDHPRDTLLVTIYFFAQ
jgi:hypothetical protein